MSTDSLGTGRGDHLSEVEATPDVDHHLVITAASRNARAELGLTPWAVLEDLALDGRSDSEGRLVAATNVRHIAIHLGISKDTAARALACLADAGSSSVHLIVAAPTVRSLPRPTCFTSVRALVLPWRAQGRGQRLALPPSWT